MNALRRVVVVGGSSIGWIAAAALRRTLRHLELDVAVLDLGPEAGAPAGRWTLPSQRGAHAQIGVAEPEFLRRTGAAFKLASEHVGWQGKGSRFLHAHSQLGVAIEGTPFYKYLQARAVEGAPENPERFSVGALAAAQGRFARPMGAAHELTASFTYGFHVEERPYVEFLREHAEKAGARRIQGTLAGVSRDAQGDCQALILEGGEQLAADLFIDCTGQQARLISQLDESRRVDWSAWLPCDRAISCVAAPLPAPAPVMRTTATTAGWMWQAPLAQKTLAGHVYCSAFTSDDAALGAIDGARAPPVEPVVTRFSSGRRGEFWSGRCVALGAAAVYLEPLAGADLHLAQLGLALLMELFPIDADMRIESAEYNRLMAEYADAVRDFTIAHYRAGPAREGAFWAATRATAVPAGLAAKLDLYSANGRIEIGDHETFEETDWAWLLLGAAPAPAALDWQVALQLRAVQPKDVAPLAAYVERLVSTMPRHVDYLQHARGGQPRATGT